MTEVMVSMWEIDGVRREKAAHDCCRGGFRFDIRKNLTILLRVY
jgi:hypothetical protein